MKLSMVLPGMMGFILNEVADSQEKGRGEVSKERGKIRTTETSERETAQW